MSSQASPRKQGRGKEEREDRNISHPDPHDDQEETPESSKVTVERITTTEEGHTKSSAEPSETISEANKAAEESSMKENTMQGQQQAQAIPLAPVAPQTDWAEVGKNVAIGVVQILATGIVAGLVSSYSFGWFNNSEPAKK